MAQHGLDIDDLLKQIPIGDIASQFGIDESTASQAVRQALPGLLGGMAVNASDDAGAEKLTAALKQHEGAAPAKLKDVDTEDGKKIVKHVLGDKEGAVAQALGQQGQGGLGDIIQKLLPVLAPIVMAYLAKQLGGGSSQGGSGGGIGDLLGGLLGGGSSTASSSGGGLGDLLGGLLGGGSGSGAAKSGGGLGDILGGLLGGGR